MDICNVSGCEKLANAPKGMCQSHYMRAWRYGSPTHYPQTSKGLKFYNEVVIGHESEDCLIWPYSVSSKGYPSLKISGKSILVTRMACEKKNGPPPTSKHEAAHSCGNGHLGCVNPMHLSWKTRSENQMDRVLHGTSNRGTRAARNKLSESDVRNIRLMRGIKSQVDLARIYGVSPNAIHEIHAEKSWSWLR